MRTHAELLLEDAKMWKRLAHIQAHVAGADCVLDAEINLLTSNALLPSNSRYRTMDSL